MNDKYLGKATILENAPVGQDFCFFPWAYSSVIFDVYEFHEDKVKCIADGYGLVGSKESYGNGAIYVNPKYLCWIEKGQKPAILKNIGWYKKEGL